MFKYLKWELLYQSKKSLKVLLIILATFLLFFIIPNDADGFFANAIRFAVAMEVVYIFYGIYIGGTLRTIKTFENKTFLLESMIALPSKTILLAKYCLSFIVSVVYTLLLFVYAFIFVDKLGKDSFAQELILNIVEEIGAQAIFEGVLEILIIALAFSSVVILLYILFKSLWPSKKPSVFILIVITSILSSVYSGFVIGIAEAAGLEYGLLFTTVCSALVMIVSYYISLYLVNNKLEIYN